MVDGRRTPTRTSQDFRLATEPDGRWECGFIQISPTDLRLFGKSTGAIPDLRRFDTLFDFLWALLLLRCVPGDYDSRYP